MECTAKNAVIAQLTYAKQTKKEIIDRYKQHKNS